MRKIVLTLILLTLGLSETYGQDFSENSIFTGLGLGMWRNSTEEKGYGINWTIGYQKNIWKDRLRFVPNLNFGNYSSEGIEDATELNANSTTLSVNLNFDVLRIKSFSIFIGSGLALNYSSGLSSYSGHFHNTNIAANALLGFKINPKMKRFSYELILVNMSSKSDFSELSLLKFRIVIKLK